MGRHHRTPPMCNTGRGLKILHRCANRSESCIEQGGSLWPHTLTDRDFKKGLCRYYKLYTFGSGTAMRTLSGHALVCNMRLHGVRDNYSKFLSTKLVKHCSPVRWGHGVGWFPEFIFWDEFNGVSLNAPKLTSLVHETVSMASAISLFSIA